MAEKRKTIALAEAMERASADPSALGAEELVARHAISAREAEAEYGPHVPPLCLPRRGRPPAGASFDAAKSKAVKMPPAFWEKFQSVASREGLTVHGAIRAALLEYMDRKRV